MSDQSPEGTWLGDGPPISRELANALAERLNAVTPWHVKVRVFLTSQDGVGHKIRSWWWMSWVQGEERGGSRETTIWNLLGAVQSYMSEKTKRAWPGEGALPGLPTGDGPSTRREIEEHAIKLTDELPLPGLAIEGSVIRLWYGDEVKPVLELEPIQSRRLPD